MQDPLKLLEQCCGVFANDLDRIPLNHRTYSIPDGFQVQHLSYLKPLQWDFEDVGIIIYEVDKPNNGYIQLSYFISFDEWQKTFDVKLKTVDILSVVFHQAYLSHFNLNAEPQNRSNELLSFRDKNPFSKNLQLCNKTQTLLKTIIEHPYTASLGSLFVNAQAQLLLLYGLEDCAMEKNETHFMCKFLSNEVDQAKIHLAKEILKQHLDQPITIKELSKKVAMNECYLKKGFKEIVGSTIFEFYQHERMSYAKMLLTERGLNVTEASELLGYSSISHFSTAFKKQTGIKPCELLLR